MRALLAVVATGLLLEQLWRRRRARRRLRRLLEQAAGQEGRVVITGADRGIGRELARQLQGHVSLLLGCVAGCELEAARVEELDLLDFDSVQRFAAARHEILSCYIDL